MSSSSDSEEIPKNIKNMHISDSDSDSDSKKKEQQSKQSEQQQEKQQQEQTKAPKDDSISDSDEENKNKEKKDLKETVKQEGEKLKQQGLSASEILKQKMLESKDKIKNMHDNLKKNPQDAQQIAQQALGEGQQTKEGILQQGEDAKAAAIGSVTGALGAVVASQMMTSTNGDNAKETEEEEQKTNIKPRPQREKQALKFQLDDKAVMKFRKESYDILKEWDDKCQQYFNLHRIVSEAAYARIERRVKISIESIKNIIVYFQNKAQFEHNSNKSHLTRLPKLSMLFKDMQDSNTVMYPVLSRGLLECDDMNDQQAKLVLVFANYIDKNILKDMLQHNSADFEKKVTAQIEKVKKARSKAQDSAKRYSKDSQKYQKIYQDLMVTEGKATSRHKDFYNIELKFKSAALDYMSTEKEFGTEVYKLWTDVRKWETHRMDILQRAFKMYIEKYRATYGVLPSMEQALKSWTEFDYAQEVDNNYSFKAILNKEDQSQLAKGLGKSLDEELNDKDAEKYMSRFTCDELDKYSKLVLQTFLAQRDVATMKKVFKNCELVVTIDDFLLFFDDPSETEIQKANKKLHMNKISVKKIKDKKRELYIIEKIPGLVYNTSNKILVKFENDEEMEEFVEYVAKFTKIGEVDK